MLQLYFRPTAPRGIESKDGPARWSALARSESDRLSFAQHRVDVASMGATTAAAVILKNSRTLGVGDGQKNARIMVRGGGNSRQPGVGGSTGERCRTRKRVSIPLRRAENRQSYRCGCRCPGRSERVLRGRGLGRSLEVRGWRKSLGADLRQAAGRRHRCSRRRALGAQHGVGRHGRGLDDSRQRRHGQRDLQID